MARANRRSQKAVREGGDRNDIGAGRADANLSSGASASGSSSSQENSANDAVPRRTCLQTQLRKTKLCMYFLRGVCQYGKECAFAHTVSELQAMPDLRKTRLCTDFIEGRGCTNQSCTFAHGDQELRSTDLFYKKSLCIWHEKGKCRNGDQCRFAHGIEELYHHLGMSPPAHPELANPELAKPEPANPERACRGQAIAVLGSSHRDEGAQDHVARVVPTTLNGLGARAQRQQATNANLGLGFSGLTHLDAGLQENDSRVREVAAMEPMKIKPGRNLYSPEPATALEALAGLGSSQAGNDGLLVEIDRLRDAISALTVQFCAMRTTAYLQGTPPPCFAEAGGLLYDMPIEARSMLDRYSGC